MATVLHVFFLQQIQLPQHISLQKFSYLKHIMLQLSITGPEVSAALPLKCWTLQPATSIDSLKGIYSIWLHGLCTWEIGEVQRKYNPTCFSFSTIDLQPEL